MYCLFCFVVDIKVIDFRFVGEGLFVRRRR